MRTLIRLEEIGADQLDTVGGKAVGLAALMRASFAVPSGFCVTTDAYSTGRIDRDELAAVLASLSPGPVAVRSSATAEDLPDASFAGQQDTILNVSGVDAVIEAIQRCWDSLHNERAISYRRAHGILEEPSMGVVVQRMVDPVTAGVLFTVDPISQTRSRAAIDAVIGLGTGVVDGTTASDHYIVDRGGRITGPDDGCLGSVQVRALAEVGQRVEAALGAPQDIEWAHDRDGALWLLQSRPITSLFPLVDCPDDGRRAYLEVGHLQGMHGPVTPMGQSVMSLALRDWLQPMGLRLDRAGAEAMMTYIGGRMFIELTTLLRSRSTRARLDRSLGLYGPRVKRSVQHLLDDPRFTPTDARLLPATTVVRVALRVAAPMVIRIVAALTDPQCARQRAFAALDAVKDAPTPAGDVDPGERLHVASRLQKPLVHAVRAQLAPLYGALIARGIAGRLLRGMADAADLAATQRGMPHNVTTQMDLDLWAVAVRARPYAHLFTDATPDELTRHYLADRLPDIGLADFLDRYGHRGPGEIDVGVARWREDPTGIFAALMGYLRVDDPDDAADRRFARAAAEAEQALRELSARAISRRPIRGRLAASLLRRNRELGGLRELPKFTWLYLLDRVRAELLRVGEQLTEAGVLDRPADIMMLSWEEAERAVGGADRREEIAARQGAYDRERRRVHVPAVLLSDGTDVEATLPAVAGEGVLAGMAAAPGVVVGRVKVVHDPRTAQLEPGDVLVAATTDPGWTPLFMTAGGLITETGSPMAHGPTVAREYGIPAVIGLREATTLLATGQVVEVDGAAGTVRVVDAATTAQASVIE